jgi:hypothetical protein
MIDRNDRSERGAQLEPVRACRKRDLALGLFSSE